MVLGLGWLDLALCRREFNRVTVSWGAGDLIMSRYVIHEVLTSVDKDSTPPLTEPPNH